MKKTCPKCNSEKLTKFFSKNHKAPDGLAYYCKKCSSDCAKDFRSKPLPNIKTTIKRFESKFEKSGSNDCWLWKSSINQNGYGVFGVGGKVLTASRVAYELYIGQIPTDKLVRHKCDNPPCVNPNHLELGTNLDNSGDMVNRERVARGESSGLSKISETDVRNIIRLRSEGITQQAVGDMFGLSRSQISNIERGISWNQQAQ